MSQQLLNIIPLVLPVGIFQTKQTKTLDNKYVSMFEHNNCPSHMPTLRYMNQINHNPQVHDNLLSLVHTWPAFVFIFIYNKCEHKNQKTDINLYLPISSFSNPSPSISSYEKLLSLSLGLSFLCFINVKYYLMYIPKTNVQFWWVFTL